MHHRASHLLPPRTFPPQLLVVALLATGCAAPLTGSFLSGSRQQEEWIESHASATDSIVPTPKEIALKKALAEPAPTQQEALAGVLEQLEQIRAIDPEAERQLMADLKQVEPEDYAMVVDTFRSALAYRQQLAQRQQRLAIEQQQKAAQATRQLITGASTAETPPHRDVDRASQDPSPLSRLAAQRTDVQQPLTPAAQHDARQPIQTVSYDQEALLLQAGRDQANQLVGHGGAPSNQPLQPIDPATTTIAASQSVVANEPVARALNAAAANGQSAPLTSSADWRDQLNAAIMDLEAHVAAKPTTVAELHDHMRLRTLQLLAGHEESAYRPIPGASPVQQDYWSKQLFAMAAYLNATQLDDKQRAVAALGSLDEARAKLSELATLQIRNLAFVESVDGFGAYTPQKKTKFSPGEKVTVYAEIDNFTSSTDEEGHHTSLGTSYQVLDKTGRRVDGKQFPDVHDSCRNRRRDFHMQYQFALPTRIYPGPYDLEITITDHHSGKIATSTIPFEIAGEQ